MSYKIYYYEIKNRVSCILYSFCISIWVSYNYKSTLLYLYIKPGALSYDKKGLYFIYTDITELFYTYINLIVTTTLQVTLFYVIYQFFHFFSPGLYIYEKNKLKKVILLIWSTWISSILLIYNIILPFSWEFFSKLQDRLGEDQIDFFFEAKLNEYLNFVASLFNISTIYVFVVHVTFAYVYQLSNTVKYLKLYRKKIYFAFFVIASIITPPDLISQITLGLTSIIIFEIYVYIIILSKSLRKPIETN